MVSSIQLTVLGCGVLGRAIVNGLLSDAPTNRSYELVLTTRRTEAVDKLKMEYPTALVTGNNRDTRIWSSEKNGASIHVAIIATQPHYTAKVCQDITDSVRTAGGRRQLIVVTVCPGITVSQLEAWLPKQTPIMRTMPNTPISVKQGATAIFSNQYMTSSLSAEVQLIFKSISPEVALLPEEDLMDIAASVSGYAPCLATPKHGSSAICS
jgi:pyrroline-5-carboxylate reductase